MTEGVALVSLHASGDAHPQPSEPQADGTAEAEAALGVSLAGLRVATRQGRAGSEEQRRRGTLLMPPGLFSFGFKYANAGATPCFAQPKPFYPLPVISLIHLQMNASCRNNIISSHSFSLVDKADEDVVSCLSILIQFKKRLTEKPNNDACRQFKCPSTAGKKIEDFGFFSLSTDILLQIA